MDHIDQQYRNNPAVREAINKALGLTTGGQPAAPALPEGVNPRDPLAPLIQQLMQGQQQVLTWQQQEQLRQQQTQQREQQRSQFLQGLQGARAAFVDKVKREPTESEMTSVANKMREAGYLNGADFVPSLFLKEIQEAATANLRASRNSKRNLPTNGSRGARQPVETQKKAKWSLESFAEDWDEHMDQ